MLRRGRYIASSLDDCYVCGSKRPNEKAELPGGFAAGAPDEDSCENETGLEFSVR